MASIHDSEIVITRVIDATRERVFKAFTDPEHIDAWWGPEGFTTVTESMDVRPGGAWKSVMRGPDGTEYPNHFVYDEIVEPKLLSYVHGDFEAGGQAYKGFKAVITFKEESGKTRVTLSTIFASLEELEKQKGLGAVEGGQQTLGRLAAYIERK